MAPFYGWGSTASRLQPLRGASLLFTPRKDERLSRPLSHQVALNTGLLDWESSALTTRPLLLKFLKNTVYMCIIPLIKL